MRAAEVVAHPVRERSSRDYAFPDPALVLAEIVLRVQGQMRRLGDAGRERLQGIGIAAPLSMGGWRSLLNFPQSLVDDWARTDLRGEVSRQTGLDVDLLKDTAAACVAELVAGRGRSVTSFLYVFVDTFIGGGLVIDSHLRGGVHGNAGAVGSFALSATQEGRQMPPQLLSSASLFNLERLFAEAGLDPAACNDERALQGEWLAHTEAWLRQAAGGIALAIHNAACLLDLEAVIVDGSFHT